MSGLSGAAQVESIDSALSTEKVRVGDTLTYAITLKGSGLEAIKSILPEVRDYYPEAETAAGPAVKGRDGKTEETLKEPVPLYRVKSALRETGPDGSVSIKVVMTYLRTGTYTLPEVKITGDDGLAIGYRVPSVTIIETNKEGKFEEIEGPIEPPSDYKAILFTMLLILLLCAIAVAAGYFLYNYIKKRRVKAVPEIQVSPYEQFLIDLKGMKPEGLIDSGDVRQYAFDMSITFRRFISARFGFDAAEMTTDEIRRSLKRFMPPVLYREHGDEIMRCMDLWDISKFAEFTPSAEMLHENLRSVKGAAEKVSAMEGDNVAPGL